MLDQRKRPSGRAASLIAACLLGAVPTSAAPTAAAPARAASTPDLHHRVVYQVSSNDPAAMQHALSSADNAFKHYRARGERARIEIVANGGGVHMLRADTTPVAPMLQYMRSSYPDLVLTACGNTKAIMEANEKRPVTLLDGVGLAPAGIVRVIELQEQGYAYVKP